MNNKKIIKSQYAFRNIISMLRKVQNLIVFSNFRIGYKVEVILGAHNIKIQEKTQVHTIGGKIIIHELYNTTSFENDIALIKLPEPVELNDFIQTVKLPSRGHNDYTNERVTSVGWGLTHDNPSPSIRDISNVLRAVNLTVTPLSECLDFNENEDNIVYVTEKNICTSGYRAKGTCEGDSGSPLLHHGKQIGIVSIGPSECEACWPSVYTDVGNFLDWIHSNSDVEIER